ncbi:MAG: hypothetical protein ACREOZ_01730 [Gloeomargaritales cyanobacterium]
MFITRIHKDEAAKKLREWRILRLRSDLLNSTTIDDSSVISDCRDASDALVSLLRSLDYPLSDNLLQAKMEVGYYLMNTRNKFDNEEYKFSVNNAAVMYVLEKSPEMAQICRTPNATAATAYGAPPTTLDKNERARLLHCVLAPENLKILKSMNTSLPREQLDARKSSDSYVEPWDEVAAMFDSDFYFAHPAPNIAKLEEIDPNKKRAGRDGDTLKKAYGKLRGAYTVVYNNWCASGQQGSEDEDGNVDMNDHAEAVEINPF